jgi:hypothetical protein
MKKSKKDYNRKQKVFPVVKFRKESITSFSGLIFIFQYFNMKELKNKVNSCFSHINHKTVIGFQKIFFILIFHVMLGFRNLRELECYRTDPLLLRLLSLRSFPCLSSLTRNMSKADETSIIALRRLIREDILMKLSSLNLKVITLDFDGSVITSSKYAEGTAVGFNKKKKGARSYYPLFCTIAQTGQVFDFHHRPGNVHDSNGALDFIKQCIENVRIYLPNCKLETRLDSAFFNDDIVKLLDTEKVEFSISVPFERFTELKAMIENKKHWSMLTSVWSYFISKWSPQCWKEKYQFIFMRQKVKKQEKGVIQLDLFRPLTFEYEYKVIISNKKTTVKNILFFHNGRGYQENIFSELKSQTHMDYIPTKNKYANILYMIAAIFAHNQLRAIQMDMRKAKKNKRNEGKPLWVFKETKIFRRRMLNIAGRIIRPQNKLILSINDNKLTKDLFKDFANFTQLPLVA